ncbi:Cytochrome P450 [Naviculisporaceae sp. PSN 640]
MVFSSAFLSAFLAIIGYSIIKRIIQAQTSPLRRIPGPGHTLYTPLVSQYHRFAGTKTYWVASLHDKYGPIVRVEPHQVSSSDPANWESMHRMGSGFRKAAFHEQFRVGPEHMLFSMVDVKKHAARRRLFARALTKDAVRRNWEGVVKKRVERAVGLLKKEMLEKGESDMLKWWRLMASDIIGALSFGEGEFDMLESGSQVGEGGGRDEANSDNGEKEYFQALQNAGPGIILRVTVPGWLLQTMVKFGWPKKVAEIMRANAVITAKGAVAVRNSKKRTGEDKSDNLFRNMLDAAEKEFAENGGSQEGVKDLTDDAIISEAAGFLLAGSDTTSMSITYALWAILKREDLRKRLEREVEDQLAEDFTDQDVEEKCPLLNSVIDESMRLYNPAAGTLIRRTPPEGVTWNGYFIPGGDEVYVMPWTLARNAQVFPMPERFDETRFLNPTDAQRRLAKPFGIGSRSCIGVPVAQMELRFAVSLFLRECKGARLGKNMTDEMMEQRTKFFTYPKGGRCDIRLGDVSGMINEWT